MPKMDWGDFQRDHHRPHLLVVSMEARKASKPRAEEADFDRIGVADHFFSPDAWQAQRALVAAV